MLGRFLNLNKWKLKDFQIALDKEAIFYSQWNIDNITTV